jgi:hypothetical protein
MPELYDNRVHLVLFEPQWRSPTYTILERFTDFYAIILGMCIPMDGVREYMERYR